MPYKPTRERCKACGTWIVETDAHGEVVRVNQKVIRRESRESVAVVDDDGIVLGPDLFAHPGAAHRLVEVYVCRCRNGRYSRVSDISAQSADTL